MHGPSPSPRTQMCQAGFLVMKVRTAPRELRGCKGDETAQTRTFRQVATVLRASADTPPRAQSTVPAGHSKTSAGVASTHRSSASSPSWYAPVPAESTTTSNLFLRSGRRESSCRNTASAMGERLSGQNSNLIESSTRPYQTRADSPDAGRG